MRDRAGGSRRPARPPAAAGWPRGMRGRTRRSSCARCRRSARRGAPPGIRWVSSACSRFTVWVRARPGRRGARPAPAARRSASSTAPAPAGAVHAATPTETRRPRRSCGRARSTASAPGRPAWPGTSTTASPSANSRVASGAPNRRRPRSPTSARASGGRTGAAAGSPARLTATRSVASGCSDASTAAAVQDALCGSTAITTGPELHSRSTPNLLDDLNQQVTGEEGTPTSGSADLSRATPADGDWPGRRPKKSQPRGRQV